ncbi:MAG: hypothetical protein LBR97_04450 [Dysgonamonadaceae bacterium]|jgi:hypothetical protein|nr:hypothetical protein [Dysgonamonadaceae bacterium]
MKKIILFFFLFIGFNQLTEAQVKIGGDGVTPPHPSSILELESTDKGLLIPRLTADEINAISDPAKGLLVFNSESGLLQINTGTPDVPQWSSLVVARGNDSATANKGALALPVGANEDRPSNPVIGMLRYNTDESRFESFDGVKWVAL